MAAVADFDFVRATFAGEMPPSQADTNAQLAHVGGGPFGRRPRHHAKPALRNCTFSLWRRAQIADAAVIKMGLATLSLAMVRETQNAT